MRIDPKRPIVVLTGAGVSVESGLPSFRGPNGLWEGHRLEEVATPEAFARDPDLVWRFYDERRRALQSPAVHPNGAHVALARLERSWPGGFLLVTQNIDDLHERAGSTRVLHMHGELLKARCTACGRVQSWLGDLGREASCPGCRSVARLRPHVVWFGEMPLEMGRIADALDTCGLFVAIGTSGVVHPAAGFVAEVRAKRRAHTIEINTEATEIGSLFAEVRKGTAGGLVPELVEELLATV